MLLKIKDRPQEILERPRNVLDTKELIKKSGMLQKTKAVSFESDKKSLRELPKKAGLTRLILCDSPDAVAATGVCPDAGGNRRSRRAQLAATG